MSAKSEVRANADRWLHVSCQQPIKARSSTNLRYIRVRKTAPATKLQLIFWYCVLEWIVRCRHRGVPYSKEIRATPNEPKSQ